MQCSVEQPWNMASITDAYGTTHSVIRQARLLTVALPFGCSLPQQYTRPGLQSSQTPGVSSTCSMQWKKVQSTDPTTKVLQGKEAVISQPSRIQVLILKFPFTVNKCWEHYNFSCQGLRCLINCVYKITPLGMIFRGEVGGATEFQTTSYV